jgi:hypothetical protein
MMPHRVGKIIGFTMKKTRLAGSCHRCQMRVRKR